MNQTKTIILKNIYAARKRISAYIRKTPLIEAPQLSQSAAANVTLKLENLQATGAFKLRGATNKIFSLSDKELSRGVITVSSGNHGRAISRISSELGIRAIVCLADTVPQNKIRAIRDLGGEVVIAGSSYDEVCEHAARLQNEHGLTMISSFDDPFIIAGQGTIGLELLEDLPDIDTVIIPLSGGSLFSGIALALKSADPDIHTVGVSMVRGPAMVNSLKVGRIVDVVEETTLADGLMGGIGADNQYTFRMVQQYVDETVLVTEDEISGAMAFALKKHRLIVEGAGAVGIAALLANKVKGIGENVVIIISGGNVELPVLLKQPFESWRDCFGL